MIKTQVGLTDLNELKNRLAAAEYKIAHRTQPHRAIKNRQNERWQKNWSSRGGEYGKPWAPLARSTVNDRRGIQRRGGLASGANASGPPLLRSGKLQGDLRSQWQASIVANGLTGWSFEGYLIYHHFGYNNVAAGKKVAPRVLFPLDERDEKEIRQIIKEWVHDALAKNHLVMV